MNFYFPSFEPLVGGAKVAGWQSATTISSRFLLAKDCHVSTNDRHLTRVGLFSLFLGWCQVSGFKIFVYCFCVAVQYVCTFFVISWARNVQLDVTCLSCYLEKRIFCFFTPEGANSILRLKTKQKQQQEINMCVLELLNVPFICVPNINNLHIKHYL